MEEKRHKGKKLLNVRHLGDILESHIEDIDLGYFWLEGEVQNLRNTKSHLYFSVVLIFPPFHAIQLCSICVDRW